MVSDIPNIMVMDKSQNFICQNFDWEFHDSVERYYGHAVIQVGVKAGIQEIPVIPYRFDFMMQNYIGPAWRKYHLLGSNYQFPWRCTDMMPDSLKK